MARVITYGTYDLFHVGHLVATTSKGVCWRGRLVDH